MIKTVGFVLLVGFLASCGGASKKKGNSNQQPENQISAINYTLVGTLPHDITSFIEGLFFKDGVIYESTGYLQDSPFSSTHFGTLDTTSGKINVKATLDRNSYFGEGISIIDGKLYQLTWKSQTCFIYNAETFELIKTVKYPNTEGWGLTQDGTNLIMSDGTYKITYVNPADFSKVKELKVTENGYAVEKLNELEYVNGFIYANVWLTNTILKIDASTGKVLAKADFGNLYQDAKRLNSGSMEMNGIAYDHEKDEFLVTGKHWPKVYLLKFQ